MKKILFIVVGSISFALGLLGAVLPLLPTTPLLLLALFSFTKSSTKLSIWLKSTTLYKKYLLDYEQKKALTVKQKLTIQVCSGIMILTSFVLLENIVMRTIAIMAFIIHNYIFIFQIKTYKPDCNKKRLLKKHPYCKGNQESRRFPSNV